MDVFFSDRGESIASTSEIHFKALHHTGPGNCVIKTVSRVDVRSVSFSFSLLLIIPMDLGVFFFLAFRVPLPPCGEQKSIFVSWRMSINEVQTIHIQILCHGVINDLVGICGGRQRYLTSKSAVETAKPCLMARVPSRPVPICHKHVRHVSLNGFQPFKVGNNYIN